VIRDMPLAFGASMLVFTNVLGAAAAAGYYGTTRGQAIGMAWSAYNSAVRIPELIG